MKKLTSLLLCLALILCSCAYAETDECEHKNYFITSEVKDGVYTPVDENFHRVTGTMVDILICTDCGAEIPKQEYEADEQQYHNYDEGVCTDCGQTCEHPTTYAFEENRDLEYAPLNEKMHTITCDVYENVLCDVCGYPMEEKLIQSGYTFEDSHFFIDGACIDCKAENTCAHENTETNDAFEYVECQPKDEKEHTVLGLLYADTYCLDCGEEISHELVQENAERTEEHWFFEGICYQCGAENTCAHENLEVTTDFVTLTCEPKDDFYHTLSGEQYSVSVCLDCGEEVSRDLMNEQFTADADHWFVKNKCIDCGYIDQIAERVRLTRDVVDSMETLSGLIEGMSGSVKLLNTAVLLTEEEQAAYDQLPLIDQAMVVMSAIGYQDAVQEALGYELFELTDEAMTLIQTIGDRLGAMTEDEQAAFEAELDSFFPVERTDANGVAMRGLSVEISSPENDGAMTEVYALQYSEITEEWAFDMIEAG